MSLSEKDRTHDLQACPFCGCHGLSFAWPREFRGRMVAIIECHTDNCYALLTAETPDRAVVAWNRRARTETGGDQECPRCSGAEIVAIGDGQYDDCPCAEPDQ